MTDPGRRAARQRPTESTGAEPYRFIGVGVTWVLITLAGVAVGRWADARFGTAPLLTLVGLLLGTVAGFAYMYHQTVVTPRERDRSRRERGTK